MTAVPARAGRTAGPRRARHAPSSAASAVLLVLGVSLFALLAGALVALVSLPAAVAVGALLMLAAALMVPLPWLFLAFVVLVFVVVGQLQYFARIDKAFWLPYLAGLVLMLRLLPARASRAGDGRGGLGDPAGWCLGLLLLTAVASSLIHRVPPMQWLVAGKEYAFLLGVLGAFVVGAVGLREIDRLWRALPWLLALQLPVVLYQRFVVTPGRIGDSPFDAVVGLFGGDPQGGGASGAMALFSVVAAVLAVEAWRAGALRPVRAGVTLVLALTPIVLAEVKFALLLFPLAMLMVFGREIGRHPLRAAGALVATGVLTLALLQAYQAQFTSDRTREGQSISAYLDTIAERNFGREQFNPLTRELGRVAALVLWADQQRAGDPAGWLIGHGMGATRVGNLVVGDVARRLQLRAGRTSLAILLWEVGLLGTAAVVAGLGLAAWRAWRLARHPALRERAWLLRGAGIGLLLILLGLPYGTDLVEVAQIQVLAWCLAGVAVAAGRQVAPASGA